MKLISSAYERHYTSRSDMVRWEFLESGVHVCEMQGAPHVPLDKHMTVYTRTATT